MAVIKITSLGGIEPSVPARALPDNGAQEARNINPASPTFRALLSDALVGACANNPATIFRFDRNPDGTVNTSDSTGWQSDTRALNLVRQQIDDDTTGKVYYTPADGSAPMRWRNALGVDRQAGVPAPTAAPTITSITDSYVFTNDLRTFELTKVLNEAVQVVTSNATPVWVGWEGPLPTGWVRRSDFTATTDPNFYETQHQVLRVFAVDPVTNAIVNTYSDIPTTEINWIFDPTLDGFYSDRSPTGTYPAWAAAASKWYCVVVRAYAEAYNIDPVAIKAGLMALKMPGTQGAEPLLTNAEADDIVTRLNDHGDKDGIRVAGKIQALHTALRDVVAKFTQGAKVSLAGQTAEFYTTSTVQDRLANERDNFARTIWSYAQRIGRATAPAYWDGGD